MNREMIEQAAKENPLVKDTPFMIDFVIAQVNQALEAAAKIVETRALARQPNRDVELTDRREGQPSIGAMLLARQIRALKVTP